MNGLAQSFLESRDAPLIERASLYIVRHGESLGQLDPANYARIGDHNLPLTETGHAQAQKAGALLSKFTAANDRGDKPLRVYFSTCVRAEQTAQNIRQALENNGRYIITEPDRRLDKQQFGLFDGLFTGAERREKYPVEYEDYKTQLAAIGPFYARPPGGQSINDISDQSEDFLADIIDDPAPAIIVTHGLNALCIERLLLGHDENWVLERADTVSNCAVRRITPQQNGFAAQSVCLDTLER